MGIEDTTKAILDLVGLQLAKRYRYIIYVTNGRKAGGRWEATDKGKRFLENELNRRAKQKKI